MRRVSSALLLVAAVAALAATPASAKPATIPSDDEIFATIEDVVELSPRRVGTPGIVKTVDYIARKYREYGLQRVHAEVAPTYSWEVLEHRLTFAGRPVDASPVVYSQSPSHDHVGETATDVRAPVVDVGLATPAEVALHDVKGKVVMFDLKFLLPIAGLVPAMEFLWDPAQTMLLSPATMLTANPYITTYTEAVKAAQDAGAVGFVGVLADYFDSNKYWNEYYRRQLVKIPGLWVTKAEGERLRGELAAKPDADAQLTMRTRRDKVDSHVVVGFLDGKSTDAIQIHSHHDSGYDGAVEDASGVGEVLALAKHYSRVPKAEREKTLMFTTFDSHFSGYSAHGAFLKRHVVARNPARDPNRIVADVTIEHIARHALRGPNGELEVSDLPEPRGIFENMSPPLKAEMIQAVVRNDLRRTALLNASPLQPVGIPTDSSGWVILGIPTASFISGPMYLYDQADTLDKVLKAELDEVATAFVEITDAIDATPPERMGAVPPPAPQELGKLLVGDGAAIPDSVDRPAGEDRPPACAEAKQGRAIDAPRLVRGKRATLLRFTGRRSLRVRVRSGGTTRALRVRACRVYRVLLPRGARRAVVSWAGGRLAVVHRP